MTPAERAFWAKLRMRASRLEPSLERAMLDGFENLRRMLSDAELLRLIDNAEAMLDGPLSEQAMDRAFAKLQDELQNGVNDATRLFGKDIGDGIRFNYLNPRFIDAIRQLNTKVMQTLREDVREVVRSHIEQGLRSGVGPRVMARGIRDVVGLSPTHEKYISNYRRALESGSRKALAYRLRDRRFDKATIRGELSPEQVDRMVERYRERWVKHNAETNARTASIDAMKLGQRLSWEDAISKNLVDESTLMMRWVTAGDDRVRPEHKKMNGEAVPFRGVFSNGEQVPGSSTFNCRCLAVVFIRKAKSAEAA
jgi:uncharacterized protein with gpF-like domain